MTLSDLAEQIKDLLDDGVPEAAEVRLGFQPSWPLVATVEHIIHTEEDGVIIVAGPNEGYGKDEWWSEKDEWGSEKE